MGTNVIILEPGQKVLIPSNITITSVIGTGLTSDCVDLPTPEEYVCWDINFGVSDDVTGAAVFGDEAGGPVIESITVGGTQYDINYDLAYVPDGGGSGPAEAVTAALKSYLESSIPQAIFDIYSVYAAPSESRTEYSIKFRTPASLAAGISMKMTGIGFIRGLTVFPGESEDCDCHEVSGDSGVTCDS